MEAPERSLEYGSTSAYSLWLPVEAPVRKMERFKAYVRKAGLVDWRARGGLSAVYGADSSECD
jgi:hypothetical protein